MTAEPTKPLITTNFTTLNIKKYHQFGEKPSLCEACTDVNLMHEVFATAFFACLYFEGSPFPPCVSTNHSTRFYSTHFTFPTTQRRGDSDKSFFHGHCHSACIHTHPSIENEPCLHGSFQTLSQDVIFCSLWFHTP